MPDTVERLHVPNLELDLRLLEASRDAAATQLERHLKVKERGDWNLEEILDADLGYLSSGFCSKSEFSTHAWAKKHGC